MLNRLYGINSTSLIHTVHKEKKTDIFHQVELRERSQRLYTRTSEVTAKVKEGIRHMAMPCRGLVLPVQDV